MDGWGTFMMTGQVRDYLAYRQEEQRKGAAEPYVNAGKGDGERTYEAECYSYRNGASGNADWRI